MKQHIYFKPIAGISVLLLGLSSVPLITRHADSPSVLDQIRNQNELIVLTRNSPTTYYAGTNGPSGFEYDLAQLFAHYLGVRLKIVTPENFNAILPNVAQRNVHFAAAGLTITENRKKQVRFGPSYQDITQQLIYRSGHPLPNNIEDLASGIIEVVAGSSHASRLEDLSRNTKTLNWKINKQAGASELLSRVWDKSIDYTIADSNAFMLNQHFYPELRVAFDLSEPEQLAWAFPKGKDDSLYNEAVKFFTLIISNGQLAQLKERHYGHVRDFDYVDNRKFRRHIEQRLPLYLDNFKQAANKYQLDWRLLAAIGYQESHWNHRAISPTGVRGIMMLTRKTAAEMGYQNRIKPQNSIDGGARYFHKLKKNIPAHIAEPDRTWFALAAYNLGMGHLHDARDLTTQHGADPDKWVDVKKHLPLLMQKRWYQKTRYGYARGIEALRYVENIRSYYDILAWQNEAESSPAPSQLVRYPVFNAAYTTPAIL